MICRNRRNASLTLLFILLGFPTPPSAAAPDPLACDNSAMRSTSPATLARGNAALRQGRPAEAAELFRSLLEKQPSPSLRARAYLGLARCATHTTFTKTNGHGRSGMVAHPFGTRDQAREELLLAEGQLRSGTWTGAEDERNHLLLQILSMRAATYEFDPGKREEARRLLAEVLNHQIRFGASARQRAETYLRLARAFWSRHERYRKAEALYQKALQLMDQTGSLPAGRHDELKEKILLGLVDCHKDLGKHEACKLLYERILKLRREGLGQDHVQVGWALYRLGIVEEELGQEGPALEHVRQALKILEAKWTGERSVLLALRDRYRKLLKKCEDGNSWFATDPKAAEARKQEELLLKAKSTPLAPGETALHRAARYALRDEVARLLAEGAEVDARDGNDRLPLHLVAATGDDVAHLEVARMLLKAGADPNSCSESYAYRPLQRAAEEGNVAMCRLLLDHGAGLELRDKMKRTPIYIAGYYGRKEVVKLFIQRGADVSAPSKGGARPLHIVASGSAFEGQEEIVHMLVAAGADVNARAEGGETPLHGAVRFGRVDMAGVLLSLGADPNRMPTSGPSLLALARRKKGQAMTELLRAHGAR